MSDQCESAPTCVEKGNEPNGDGLTNAWTEFDWESDRYQAGLDEDRAAEVDAGERKREEEKC